MIRNAENWYKKSPLNNPVSDKLNDIRRCAHRSRQWDTGLCAYTQMLRIMTHFHDEIYSNPNSPTGLNRVGQTL